MFKLSLRDLFWLVLVCGLAAGWWLERSRLIGRIVDLEGEKLFRSVVEMHRHMHDH